jgi:hypothetical protein
VDGAGDIDDVTERISASLTHDGAGASR